MDFPALDLDNPQTQYWLGLAGGLLKAGGASPMPVGLGQALGQGMQQGMGAYQQAQQSNMQNEMSRQKVAQLRQQNELNERLAPMLNNPQQFSPDVLEMMGMRAAAAGHPGAATLTKIADARRAQAENDKQFGMMKTGEGYSGLFGTLADSPYVGTEAKALQAQLDKSERGMTKEWMGRYEKLRDTHFRSLEASNKREQEPLVAVLRDGKPVYVKRSEAEGLAPANTPSLSAVPPGAENLTGDEYLKKLPPGVASLVKKVANYEIDPKTFSTRGGQREQILAHVSQYDQSFDQKNYNARYNAINRFATGPQGNTARSLNVAIEHMDTARQLGAALGNKDLPAFNALAQKIAEQTGRSAPTSFDAVKEILADEVVKGVIGGAGALEDRKQMADKIKRSASPQQLNGVLDSWTELLGGQLKGLEKQYEGSTGLKDFRERYLTERARTALTAKHSAAPTPTLENGWSADKEKRYQELKARQRGGS